MTKEKKIGKLIELKVNCNIYRIEHDGYCFRIFKGAQSEISIVKYPSTLNSALNIILRIEHLSMKSEEAISLKQFVDQYESLVKEIREMDFTTKEVELKEFPVKGKKIAVETIEEEPEEEDDEDDIF